MPSDINAAIVNACNYCWDETHGYTIGGNMNPDTDCSGLVWQALYDEGFNVGSYRFDTTTMGSVLTAAGFTEYNYYAGFPLVHGDIVMYDEGGGLNGHAFFYGENVFGYTDDTARTNSTGTLARARIEASSSRESGYLYPTDPNTQPGDVNNPDAPGDHPRNGVGAYWEVWVHPFSEPGGGHSWKVYRYQGGPVPPAPINPLDILILKKVIDRNHFM